MELAGKVIAVLEPRSGVSKTGNEWKVQEYVIETHDQYPRKMCFDVFGADKIAQFNIQVGEELNVYLDRVSAQAPVAPDAPFPPMNAAPAAPVDFASTDEKDDLPF